MARLNRRVLALFLALLPTPSLATAADILSPETHLGYQPGADYHLVGWDTVVSYFRKVDDASDRVILRELGKTTEGRPYIVAAISTPETLADLPRYQRLQHRLTDPRVPAQGNDPPDPVEASKPVVVITCSIHSNETASTYMAMELLHGLASGNDPATREILEHTIVLLVPSANPDGVDKVAQWYERSKGHPWEGAGMPELYHKYAGHDTNRDWFMLNLEETRLLTRMLYSEWRPTILYDVHQMGSKGARLFVPPFFDPINPNLDPRLSQSIFLIGAHMAADLAVAGKSGVLTNAMYDNWWNGGNRTTPQRHNIVAVLTEAASVRLATPIFLEKSELRGGARGFTDHSPTVNFVDPWPGGWWRLRDIVDYERIAARSLLTLAARYKTQFQTNLRAMGQAAIDEGAQTPPFAWVVPRNQRDPGAADEMVRILRDSGVEVRRASRPFEAGGVAYSAGSWILPASQPYRPHLKDMMERQVYPARFTAKGEAETPYDVAGWTLPLQMGVSSTAVAFPFDFHADPLESHEPLREPLANTEGAEYYRLFMRSNDDYRLINALVDAGINPVIELARPSRSTDPDAKPIHHDVVHFPVDARARHVLSTTLPLVSSKVTGDAGDPANPASGRRPAPSLRVPLRKQRIGVYQPWMPSMDEGWTRLVLERFKFVYQTLHNADVRSGELAARFDVIVLPSVDPKTLRDGYAPNETEPAYVGGLGAEGIAALREFVTAGGTLVCLENSSKFAIDALALPVSNVLKGLSTAQFYGPGSIVRATREAPFDPLLLAVPQELSVYFDHSLAFDLIRDGTSQMPPRVLMRYASPQPLESGWLLGPERIAGKAALVEVRIGDGRVLLFGFPPQHRAQTHGTFRLLFNALMVPWRAAPSPG